MVSRLFDQWSFYWLSRYPVTIVIGYWIHCIYFKSISLWLTCFYCSCRGDKALITSTKNWNMYNSNKEDNPNGPWQHIENKSDCIGFQVAACQEDREELIVEVAGPPCVKEKMKYKRDWWKLLKSMKLVLDKLVSNMDVKKVKWMCVYRLLVYGISYFLKIY